MRPIESYLMYASMYALVAQYAWYPVVIAYFTLSILVAHLVIERPRYQFYLVYAITCATAYALIGQQHIQWYWVIAGEILLLISSAVACLLKVATFPLPSGPYKQVGITTFYVHTQDFEGHPTECVVHAFYPSSTTPVFPSTSTSFLSSLSPNSPIYLRGFGGTGPSAMPKHVARSVMRFAKFPFFLMDSVPLTKIHAKLDVPLPQGENKFPVMLFSHGLGGSPESYNILATDLASYGYVVLLPTHNDGSACISTLPKGRHIHHQHLPKSSVNTPDEYPFRHRQLKQRVRECAFVMKQVMAAENGEQHGWKDLLHSGDKIPPFAGRLAVNQGWGAGGHSFGAATVTEWAKHQPHVKAVITLDLWTLPLSQGLTSKGLHQPILLMQSEPWLKWTQNMELSQELFTHSQDAGSRFLTINGSGHISFSDVPIYSPFVSRKVGEVGPINVFRFFQIMNHYNAAFLLQHIPVNTDVFTDKDKKEHAALLDVSNDKIKPKEVQWHTRS